MPAAVVDGAGGSTSRSVTVISRASSASGPSTAENRAGNPFSGRNRTGWRKGGGESGYPDPEYVRMARVSGHAPDPHVTTCTNEDPPVTSLRPWPGTHVVQMALKSPWGSPVPPD